MQNFIVDFHFLGISQNSLSLILSVVLILINKLLYAKLFFLNAKLSTIFPMFFFKFSSINLPHVQWCLMNFVG